MELDRHSADISNSARFVLLEEMPSLRRKDDEQPIVTEVLKVRISKLFASTSSRFRYGDVILCEKFLIHAAGIFVVRNFSHHIEPITMAQVRARKLLHKSFNRRSGTTIFLTHAKGYANTRRVRLQQKIKIRFRPNRISTYEK